MYWFLSFCLVALSVQSLNVRICKNCKHFIRDKTALKNGKCKISPIKLDDYLVSGDSNDIEFHFCSTARAIDDMCGFNATKYEEKTT